MGSIWFCNAIIGTFFLASSSSSWFTHILAIIPSIIIIVTMQQTTSIVTRTTQFVNRRWCLQIFFSSSMNEKKNTFHFRWPSYQTTDKNCFYALRYEALCCVVLDGVTGCVWNAFYHSVLLRSIFHWLCCAEIIFFFFFFVYDLHGMFRYHSGNEVISISMLNAYTENRNVHPPFSRI